MKDLVEARMKYIEAYAEMIRAELSYRYSAIRISQIEEEIEEKFGKEDLDRIKIYAEESDEDD